MSESAEQIPHLTQTEKLLEFSLDLRVRVAAKSTERMAGRLIHSPARGGKRIATRPRNMSGEHILLICFEFCPDGFEGI
jgi:hypothetical protein